MRSLSHDGSWTAADAGVRVMFYDVRVGRMVTWAVEDTVVEAAREAQKLKDQGYEASLFRRDYTPLSQAEILAAIAAETKEP